MEPELRFQFWEDLRQIGQNEVLPNTSWMGRDCGYQLKKRFNFFGGPRMTIGPIRLFACEPPIEVRGGQRILIGVQEDGHFVEKLSFTYFTNSGCVGDHGSDEIKFYCPDRSEPLGWIQMGRNATCGSKIGLNSPDVKFTTRQNSSPQLGVTFSNSLGQDVAMAAVTRWQTVNGVASAWEEFALTLPPPETLLSDDERTLIFGIFVLWVLNAEENMSRENCLGTTVVLFILLIIFIVGFWIFF